MCCTSIWFRSVMAALGRRLARPASPAATRVDRRCAVHRVRRTAAARTQGRGGGIRARWHHADHSANSAAEHPWLARHQLGQRLAVSDLDWATVHLGCRLPKIWDQRRAYVAKLERLPWSVAHGDLSTGNLRALDGDVVALDWATLGVSPVGLDIAQLALATLDDSLLSAYLDGLQGRYDPEAVTIGYRIAVGLVGASRAHRMATRSIPLPLVYVDFFAPTRPDRPSWPNWECHLRVRGR